MSESALLSSESNVLSPEAKGAYILLTEDRTPEMDWGNHDEVTLAQLGEKIVKFAEAITLCEAEILPAIAEQTNQRILAKQARETESEQTEVPFEELLELILDEADDITYIEAEVRPKQEVADKIDAIGL